MIEVRSPGRSEVTAVVRLAQRLHAQSEWSWVPFSAAAMRRSVVRILRRPDYRIFIAYREGEMVGLLIGMVDQVLYGRTMYATDVEFAAEAGGAELLAEFRKWAKGSGAKVVVMGDSNGGRERAKDRFFQQHGFKRTGGLYQERWL